MKTKAKAIIHLHGGQAIRVPDTLDEASVKIAAMLTSKPGSAFRWDSITGHGTLKQVVIPAGLITYVEEA